MKLTTYLAKAKNIPVHVAEQSIMEAASEIMYRALARGDALTDPSSAARYFGARLRRSEHEVFAVLFLDTRHRVIEYQEMFRGTIDGAEVHPREIVKEALKLNAAAIMVAHNHPSGHTEPSAADRAVTARLKQALTLVDIRLLDHFIIGDSHPVSLAARGWV